MASKCRLGFTQFLLFFLSPLVLCQTTPRQKFTFTAVSSKLFRSNSNYTISLSFDKESLSSTKQILKFVIIKSYVYPWSGVSSTIPMFTSEDIIVPQIFNVFENESAPSSSSVDDLHKIISISIPTLPQSEQNGRWYLHAVKSQENIQNNSTVTFTNWYPSLRHEIYFEADEVTKSNKNSTTPTLAFIETDKPVYKPGESVKFRIFFLDSNKLPCVSPTMGLNVSVIDSQKNVVRRWVKYNQSSSLDEIDDSGSGVHSGGNGLYRFKFDLATEPNLGQWSILAESSGVKNEVNIMVDKVVLPKFKVEVKAPTTVIASVSDKVAVQVRAFYSYGKGVNGAAKVTINNPTSSPQVKTVEMVEGIGTLEFSVEKIQNETTNPYNFGCHHRPGTYFTFSIAADNTMNWHGRRHHHPHLCLPFFRRSTQNQLSTYTLTANVSESNTTRWGTGETEVKVYQKEEFKIEWINQRKKYKPGFPINFQIKVTNVANEPMTDLRPDALVLTFQNRSIKSAVPPGGIAPLFFDTTSQDLTLSPITITYKSASQTLEPLQPYLTLSDTFLEVTCSKELGHYVKGQSYTFKIRANKPIEGGLNFILVDGQKLTILHYGRITLSSPSTEADVPINMPLGSYVDLKLAVYLTVTRTKEMITATCPISFKNGENVNFLEVDLQNGENDLNFSSTNLTSPPSYYQPGDPITFQFKSLPHSTVAIRGVDQSVLFLSSQDNDVTEQKVKDGATSRMASQNRIQGSNHVSAWFGMENEFDQLGLILLTNGDTAELEQGLQKKNQEFIRELLDIKAEREKEDRRKAAEKQRKEIEEWRKQMERSMLDTRTRPLKEPQNHQNMKYTARGHGRATSQRSSYLHGPVALDTMPENEGRTIANVPLPHLDSQNANSETKSSRLESHEATAAAPIRKYFPETWLWEDFTVDSNGTMDLHKIIPDTITSWLVTGYSLNQNSGLGFNSHGSNKIVVFRPFFVTLNLPYSVVTGETFALEIIVHNYLEENVTARVSLDNLRRDFEFIDLQNNDGNDQNDNQNFASQLVNVTAGKVAAVYFIIKPTKFGNIFLDVMATTDRAGDRVSRPLRVKPPGVQCFKNRAILLDLKPEVPTDIENEGQADEHQNELTTEQYNLTLTFPDDRVEGSERVTLTIIGDQMGPMFTNLDHLIALPTGCGEQNMLKFVPNILALDYLSALQILEPQMKKRALEYLALGYQNQLKFKKADGSFAVFPQSEGSTWLTAYVIKSFAAARKYVTIDDDIVSKGIDFLLKNQRQSGEFVEEGLVYSTSMRSRSASKGAALTAFTTLALLQMLGQRETEQEPQENERLKRSIEKGLNFISRDFSINYDDPYLVNLVTLTLVLGNHSQADNFFDRMESLAVHDGVHFKFWSESNEANGEETRASPLSIEMTAYALLVHLNRFKSQSAISASVSIAKWLLAQRNDRGGFYSTQDTVMGLSALTQFALLTRAQASDAINLKIEPEVGENNLVDVTTENSMVLQEFSLDSTSHWVHVEAKGRGPALVQLTQSWYFDPNATTKGTWDHFNVTAKMEQLDGSDKVGLRICTAALNVNKTADVIAEINLPSGYYFEGDYFESGIPPAGQNPEANVKRLELQDGNSKLVTYYEYTTKEPTCLTLPSYRADTIADIKNPAVIVYDYADPTIEKVISYEPIGNVGVDDLVSKYAGMST